MRLSCYHVFAILISSCAFIFSGFETIQIVSNKNDTRIFDLNAEDLVLINSNILLVVSLFYIIQTITFIIFTHKISKIRIHYGDDNNYNPFN